MHSTRQVTLRDVARAAGVSKATASKALNGAYPVAEQTRVRVNAAADRLGFRPSALATSLSTGRSRTVGLVMLDDRLERFVSPISLGVEDALRSIDLALILANARGDETRLDALLSVLTARRADGVVVVGDNNTVWPSITDRVATPMVYAYCQTDRGDDVCHLPDDRTAVAELVDYLVAAGRTRIAHVTGPRESLSVKQRLSGLRLALRRNGLRLVAAPMHGDWSQRWGSHAAAELLDSHPSVDAVVCGSDQIAYGVLAALTAGGRAVPDEVAVTGFDNWAPFAQEAVPALTTIDSNLESLGAAAAHDLFARMEGRSAAGGKHRHACTLIVRDSTPETNTAPQTKPPAAVSR